MRTVHCMWLIITCCAITMSYGAPPYDPWADEVDAGNTISITNPENALGAPDGSSAVVASLLGASLSLDLGANEVSDRDLLVYYTGVSAGLIAPVEFYDSGSNLVGSADLLLAASVGPSLAAALYTNNIPYRHVILRGNIAGIYGVDAIKAIDSPEPLDGYADAASLFGTTLIINPNNATGAPNGQYSTIVSLAGGGIELDLGAGEEGTWDLIIHYGTLAAQLATTVRFLDSNHNVLASSPLLLGASLGNAQAAVAYTNAPNPYRYVQINALVAAFLLDAVEIMASGSDSDGDGIPNVDEDVNNNGTQADDDTDGDGIPNALDPDDDGDGVLTADEIGGDPENPEDTDGDTIPDYLDSDDDGDSVPTLKEIGGDSENPSNTDGDGLPDYLDSDDDGDTVPTLDEVGGDPENPNDTDGDTIPDYLDSDDDGDSMPTIDEVGGDPENPVNSDGDGIPDYLDPDDDNDTVLTIDEVGGDPENPIDTDGDTIPDYLDPDDDNDQIPTKYEDRDGDNDPTNDDTNGNGIPDYLDPIPPHVAAMVAEQADGLLTINWTNLLPGVSYDLEVTSDLLSYSWIVQITNTIAPSQSILMEDIPFDSSVIKFFRLVEKIPAD